MSSRTALVTGASRPEGLGFAVARELAGLGHHVVLTSRTRERAEDLADRLRDEGLSAGGLELDVTDPATVAAAALALGEEMDALDVLVNNASVVPDFGAASALDVDPEQARLAYDLDVVGTWRLTQALLPLLLRAPAARIVNVSSQDALRIVDTAAGSGEAQVASPAFSMAKYALNALTGVLAAALRDTPILVNAVDPGETATHPETGDEGDARPAAESAHGVVWAATLGADGPTGGFFRDGRPLT